MSNRWTHAICTDCWDKKRPDSPAPRLPDGRDIESGPLEMCCFCGAGTAAGIYVRADPQTTKCGGEHLKKEDLAPLGDVERRQRALRSRQTVEDILNDKDDDWDTPDCCIHHRDAWIVLVEEIKRLRILLKIKGKLSLD